MELAVKPRDVHKAWDRCCSPVGAQGLSQSRELLSHKAWINKGGT